MVLQQGFKHQTKHFIWYLLATQIPNHRLGIIVTKKVANAVGRNRIKRLLREYFRLYFGAWFVQKPFYDVVIIAKRGSPFLDLQRVRMELDAYFEKYFYFHGEKLSNGSITLVSR